VRHRRHATRSSNPDYLLTPQDIERWEREHGRVPRNAWVLLRTGWSTRDVGREFLNVGDDGPHAPASTRTRRLLAHDRDVLGVGVETIGTDAGQAGRSTRRSPITRSCTAPASSAWRASAISTSFRRRGGRHRRAAQDRERKRKSAARHCDRAVSDAPGSGMPNDGRVDDHGDSKRTWISAISSRAETGISVIRGGGTCTSWNGIRYRAGLSAKNVGATKLSMNVAPFRLAAWRTRTFHVDFEVMLYILQGHVRHEYGPGPAKDRGE
jgi:hypothetical protein